MESFEGTIIYPAPVVQTKRCGRCWKVRLLTEFHKDKSSPDGRRTTCGECTAAYSKEWREINGLCRKRKEIKNKSHEAKFRTADTPVVKISQETSYEKIIRIEKMVFKILDLIQNEQTVQKMDKTKASSEVASLEPTVQKMDNTKPSSDRCRDLIKAGVQKEALRAYILQESGEKETKTVSPAQWNAILTPLETILSESGNIAVNSTITAQPVGALPDFMRVDTSIDLDKFKKHLTELVA